MGEFNLFGLGHHSRSPNVTAQKRMNVYFEFQKDGDGTNIACYGRPGLSSFVDFGAYPCRGFIVFGDNLYTVNRSTFWEISNAGVKTSRGTLNIAPGAGTVYMAANATQIMIVDGADGWTYTPSTTTFAEISDVDFPANANSVDYMDTYFIVSRADSGKFNISAQNNGTAWDGTDFATAESSPDNLVRVFCDHGQLILFGVATIEFWANTGAADFPFERITGAQNEWGLAARASLVKYDNSCAFLAKNRMGEIIVARLNGYQVERISDHDLEAIINAYSAFSDASAFSYLQSGHPFYQLNFPTANESWLYDGSTQIWSQVSYGVEGDRHRAETHSNFLGRNYVGDWETGQVYRMLDTVYTDNGNTIQRQLRSKHLSNNRGMLVVDSVELNMEGGVGISASVTEPLNTLQLPGTTSDYASAPYIAAYAIAGDLTIIVHAAADDWTPATAMSMLSKWAGTRSFDFKVTASGYLQFAVTENGSTATQYTSGATISSSGGSSLWCRAVFDATDGVQSTATFYTAPDPGTGILPTVWNQLGAAATSTPKTIYTAAAVGLEIGRSGSSTGQPFSGDIYQALLYNSSGTLVAHFNAEDAAIGAATVVSSATGETWTLQGAAAIVAGDVQVPTGTLAPGSNPQAMLRISRDFGHKWGHELWADIGAIGKYLTRVIWRQLGAARNFVFEVTITDPVKIAITGATVHTRKGA